MDSNITIDTCTFNSKSDNSAAFTIEKGYNLNITGTTSFTANGKNSKAISINSGNVNIPDGTLSFNANGDEGYCFYYKGASKSGNEISLSTSNTYTASGEKSVGVYIKGGTATFSKQNTINMKGKNSTGIYLDNADLTISSSGILTSYVTKVTTSDDISIPVYLKDNSKLTIEKSLSIEASNRKDPPFVLKSSELYIKVFPTLTINDNCNKIAEITEGSTLRLHPTSSNPIDLGKKRILINQPENYKTRNNNRNKIIIDTDSTGLFSSEGTLTYSDDNYPLISTINADLI